MKKLIPTILLMVLFSGVGCKKSTDGNKNVLVENTENSSSATSEITERYVATDGSSALVTFKNINNEKSISIKSNNKTVSAPQKEMTADGGIYGNYDFKIVAKKDSVIITQGDNVIKLKKARGQ